MYTPHASLADPLRVAARWVETHPETPPISVTVRNDSTAPLIHLRGSDFPEVDASDIHVTAYTDGVAHVRLDYDGVRLVAVFSNGQNPHDLMPAHVVEAVRRFVNKQLWGAR